MSPRIVLDAAAFDVMDTREGPALRALLRAAVVRGGEVVTCAVTLAEVCRGTARTRRVEAAIARDRGGRRIQVVATDARLAKLVGALLHAAGRDSSSLADAHVVAACAASEQALVITADPEDISDLADGLPGTRVMIRHPERLGAN